MNKLLEILLRLAVAILLALSIAGFVINVRNPEMTEMQVWFYMLERVF